MEIVNQYSDNIGIHACVYCVSVCVWCVCVRCVCVRCVCVCGLCACICNQLIYDICIATLYVMHC